MPDNQVTSQALGQQSLVQWPLFLLANKVSFSPLFLLLLEILMVEFRVLTSIFLLCAQVYVGIDIVKENRQTFQDDLVWERIRRDPYLEYAVLEAFYTLQNVLEHLLNEHGRAW